MKTLPGAVRVVLVAAVLVTAAGCASTPPAPNDALQAAELAIGRAEEARVADYASLEMRSARDKLTAARAAVEAKEMDKARVLAEQAKVDADLATAKAEAAKAKSVNEEMRKNTDVLQQELQRSNQPGQ